MKSIVTGGAGFIGLNLVEQLLSRGDQVVIIDNLMTGTNLPALSKLLNGNQLRFIKANILENDLENLLEAGDDADTNFDIYHLAASHVGTSPMSSIVDNTLGTACVLEAVRKFPKTRLLIVSVAEIYGGKGPAYQNSTLALSPYLASRAGANLLANAYRRTYNLPIKISRSCNNFGRYQHSEKFILKALRCIKANEPVPLYNMGKQPRQWVPVEVHVARLIEFMGGDTLDQHVGGFLIADLELIQMISAIVGDYVRWVKIQGHSNHDFECELLDNRSINQAEFVKYLKKCIEAEIGQVGVKGSPA